MRRALLAALAGLVVAAGVQAAMVRIPFERVVAESNAIVRAHVVALDSHWLDGARVIVTDATLRVDEAWKGALAPGATIVVRVRGGTVDGLTLTVEHQPAFAPDEDAVVFLSAPVDSRHVVAFVEQGKYTVVEDRAVSFEHLAQPLVTLRAEVKRLVVSGNR